MRLALPIALIAAALLLVVLGNSAFPGVMDWAVTQQRAFQNEMAGAVRAIRAGEPGGWAALMLAAGTYGLVHAAGPGHGKYLIGGVGLASGATARRMVTLALVSSLAQALWAVILVYGGFALLQISARHLTGLAEAWLAPASYLAISAIGAVLALRGARRLPPWRREEVDHCSHPPDHVEPHGHTPCASCGHAHGPSPEEAASATSLRAAAGLVASIAIRPCTGAIFLLVIAWQLDIKAAGAAAVLTMGLGTAILTSGVGLSSVLLRGMALFPAGRGTSLAAPVLQIIAGLLILWFSLGMLAATRL